MSAPSGDLIPRGRLPVGGTLALAVRLLGRAPAQLVFILLAQLVVTAAATFVTNRLLASSLPHAALSLIDFVLNTVCAALATGLIISIAFAAAAQHACGIGEAFDASLRRLGAMVILFFLQTVIAIVAFLLLIVPVFIAAAVLSAAVPACVIEALSPLASLERSIALTRGNRWRIFAIFGIMFLAAVICVALLLPIIWHANIVTIVVFALGLLGLVAVFLVSPILSTALYVGLRALEA